MPIFEYKCSKCGYKMEFLERGSSKGKHICEKCGSSDIQKLFSTFSATISSKPASGGSCPTGTCGLS